MNIKTLEKALLGKHVTKNADGTLLIDGQEVTTHAIGGDCCAYAYAEVEHFTDGIITHIKTLDRENYGDSTVAVTIYHENTKLAELMANAGSGSGWSYGAISQILLNGEELITATW